jgi:hypothetical protein
MDFAKLRRQQTGRGGLLHFVRYFDFILVSVDSAFTEKEENDPTGCTTWGVWTDPANDILGVAMLLGITASRKAASLDSGQRRLAKVAARVPRCAEVY